MKTRSGLSSVLKETANDATEQDTYSLAGPPRKKRFKPKGVNKKWGRRKRNKMCKGGRCGG